MKNELVSICVPVYNGEKYLRECLTSCINQTYPHYEVIICDDGSVDNSKKIIEEFAVQHQKIKRYHNDQNLGLVGNWNKCLEKSNGSWVKFMFQDDYMRTDCLEKFIASANDSTKLLVSRRNFIFEYEPGPQERADYLRKSELFDIAAGNQVLHLSAAKVTALASENININFIGEPSLTMFRKSAAGKGFDSSFKQVCDLDLLLRIAGERGLTYLPLDLCFFRLHAQTTTSKNLRLDNFHIRYLEPLLMSAKMLADPDYESLRSNMSWWHQMRVKLFLNTRYAETKKAARKLNQGLTVKEYLIKNPVITSELRHGFTYSLALLALKLKRLIKNNS
jgi:glycosyltransferase involved in cell wall biosynthesis